MRESFEIAWRQIKHQNLLLVSSAVLSLMFGLAVEVYFDKTHSIYAVTLLCLAMGLAGTIGVVLYDQPILLRHYSLKGWKCSLSFLVVGGWIFDIEHGYVWSHQAANYVSFLTGALIGFAYLWKFDRDRLPSLPEESTSSDSKSDVSVHALKVSTTAIDSSSNRQGPTHVTTRTATTLIDTRDLPSLIRNLVFSLNHLKSPNRARHEEFVRANLAAAIGGFIRIRRLDKAGALCHKVDHSGIPLGPYLKDLPVADSLGIALGAFKNGHTLTAIKILDSAYRYNPGDILERRILSTARAMAHQTMELDPTFQAHLTRSDVSPNMKATIEYLQDPLLKTGE